MKREKTIQYGLKFGHKEDGSLFACKIDPSGEDIPQQLFSLFGFNSDGCAKKEELEKISLDKYEEMLLAFQIKIEKRDNITMDHILVSNLGIEKCITVNGTFKFMQEIPDNEIFEFSDNFNRGDMTKWGASDFYDDKREEIMKAIASKLPFETGWGGCKKEILSSQIVYDGNFFDCSVSVSDDFDTEGMGDFCANRGETDEETMDNIKKALCQAADLAEENQKDNRVYRGFSIIDKNGGWTETYIQDTGSWGSEYPPGDNYHQWGFQGENESLTEEIKEKMEEWITSYPEDGETFEIEGWKVKPWGE